MLSGRPSLRTPGGVRQLEQGEAVRFELGEAGAHQLFNPTDVEVRFLAVSSHGAPDIVVYPDSNKISARERNPDGEGLHTFFDRGDEVDYWQGETPPDVKTPPGPPAARIAPHRSSPGGYPLSVRRLIGLLGVLALLACVLAVDGTGRAAAEPPAAGEPPPEPTCAEGPAREGDEIVGTPCADTIVVPASVTYVDGGAGNDVIREAPAAAAAAPLAGATCEPRCGLGSQTFEGGPGDDVVYGERGNDILRGNEGNDRLYGGIGDDQLLGGPGNDFLEGGFGADSIDGGEGDDFVRGGGTTDKIFDTGGGNDTLSYAGAVTPGFGGNVVSGVTNFPNGGGEAERGVYLNLAPGAPEPKDFNGNDGGAGDGGGSDQVEKGVFETIIGSPYADYIVGGEGGETIYGGGGADVIEGRGGVDHLFGGADGDDLDAGGQPGDTADGGEGVNTCQGVETPANCTLSGTKAVATRAKAKVSVGVMAPGPNGEIYLTGSSAADSVTATYAPPVVNLQIAGASFQKPGEAEAGTAVQEEGCAILSSSVATCPVAGLSEVTIAGLGGNDVISANGFPQEVGVALLGGEGADTLTGGEASEDLLADGRGDFADTLSGLGGDDALVHQDGADHLNGGDGDDLFLSTSICDGETLNGETGVDNSSWAKGPGVDANLELDRVGQFGVGSTPACSSGTPDVMESIEDLEGSESEDRLVGNREDNQLLGHRGADEFFAGEGEDLVLANSGDSDRTIDCGPQTDRAVLDIPHPGEYEDPAPIECETERQGIPEEETAVTELVGPPAPAPEPTPVFVRPPPTPPAVPPAPPADTKPPRTSIAKRPAKLVRARRLPVRVVFRFKAGERGARFRCRLDRQPFGRCRSPRAYRVGAGRHVFRVFAIDAAGNRDRTPASFAFRVKRRPLLRHHSRHRPRF